MSRYHRAHLHLNLVSSPARYGTPHHRRQRPCRLQCRTRIPQVRQDHADHHDHAGQRRFLFETHAVQCLCAEEVARAIGVEPSADDGRADQHDAAGSCATAGNRHRQARGTDQSGALPIWQAGARARGGSGAPAARRQCGRAGAVGQRFARLRGVPRQARSGQARGGDRRGPDRLRIRQRPAGSRYRADRGRSVVLSAVVAAAGGGRRDRQGGAGGGRRRVALGHHGGLGRGRGRGRYPAK